MAPRNRDKHQELEGFPGLIPDSRSGIYQIRHPVTKRQASLKTRDEAKAKQLYSMLMAKWQKEAGEYAADALMKRFESLSSDTTLPSHTIAEYAGIYRTERLGVNVRQEGNRNRFEYGECKVLSNRGKVLGASTVRDYAGYCLNYYEKSEILQRTNLDHPDVTFRLQQFLGEYSAKPTTYNHLLACLSKIFQDAFKSGLVRSNPCRDIPLAVIPKKTEQEKADQYIPDEAYAAITQAMMVENYGGKSRDGEYRARLCDLMLFMSSRAGDSVEVLDADFDQNGHFIYETNKTAELVWIEDVTGELAETVKWFRQWKRRLGIISKYLCVHPKWKRKGHAGTPITVKWLSGEFSKAVIAAGFPKGRWQLRLIRHKGLTDEAIKDESNNKGAHRTESARKIYQTQKLPTRVKNTLENPRNKVSKIG